MITGNVIARDSAKEMSVKELQNEVASSNEDILNKLRYYSKVIKGSPTYWFNEQKKMKALSRHIIHRSNNKEQMNIFQTFSPGRVNLHIYMIMAQIICLQLTYDYAVNQLLPFF